MMKLYTKKELEEILNNADAYQTTIFLNQKNYNQDEIKVLYQIRCKYDIKKYEIWFDDNIFKPMTYYAMNDETLFKLINALYASWENITEINQVITEIKNIYKN